MNEQLQSKPIENNKCNTNRSKTRDQQTEITIGMTEATPGKCLVIKEINCNQCE